MGTIMELLCPECMAPLVTADGRTATCTTHGGTYQILFSRYPIAGPARQFMPAPGMTPGALGLGSGDLAALAQAATQARAPYPVSIAEGMALEGAVCITHPTVPAVARCQTCRAPVCSTCVFVFPGGVHLCPACASNPAPQISPRRRNLGWWSVAMSVVAIGATVGIFVLGAITRNREETAAGAGLLGIVAFSAGLTGIGLGVATFDKRMSTPVAGWIGVIGNGFVLLVWLLLIIVGLMMKAH
jgi:hypothetical protein